MTREEIIRNLEYTMEKHKNDTVDTFGTNISVMCKDILDYLEQEPCEDAISRQAVLAEILKKPAWHNSDGAYYHSDDIRDAVNNTPSVTPKPKTGHWRHYEGMLYCSKCGSEFYDEITEYTGDEVPKCCPDCGAKMVEQQEGKDKG